jgi:hypothetical protein
VDNVVADALSRPAAAVVLPSQVKVDLVQLARAQATCGDTQQLAVNSSLQVQQLLVDGVQLLCDVSTGAVRLLVPTCMRKVVFAAVHELAHPGVLATRRLVSSRFIWKS